MPTGLSWSGSNRVTESRPFWEGGLLWHFNVPSCPETSPLAPDSASAATLKKAMSDHLLLL